MKHFKEFFHKAGDGIVVDVGLGNPEVAVRQVRLLVRLPQVEVGIEHPMRQDMLQLFTKQLTIDN